MFRRPWKMGDALPTRDVVKKDPPKRSEKVVKESNAEPDQVDRVVCRKMIQASDVGLTPMRSYAQTQKALDVASDPELLAKALKEWDTSYSGLVTDKTLVGRIQRYHQILAAAGMEAIPVTKHTLDVFAACLTAAKYKTADDAVRAVRAYYSRFPDMVELSEADNKSIANSFMRLNNQGALDHVPAEPMFLSGILAKFPKESRNRHAALAMFYCALRISELKHVSAETLTIDKDLITLNLKKVICKSNKIRTVFVRCICADEIPEEVKQLCLCHTVRFLQNNKEENKFGMIFNHFESFCKRSMNNRTHGFRIGCLRHLLFLKDVNAAAIQTHCRWSSDHMVAYYRRKIVSLERDERFKSLNFLP